MPKLKGNGGKINKLSSRLRNTLHTLERIMPLTNTIPLITQEALDKCICELYTISMEFNEIDSGYEDKTFEKAIQHVETLLNNEMADFDSQVSCFKNTKGDVCEKKEIMGALLAFVDSTINDLEEVSEKITSKINREMMQNKKIKEFLEKIKWENERYDRGVEIGLSIGLIGVMGAIIGGATPFMMVLTAAGGIIAGLSKLFEYTNNLSKKIDLPGLKWEAEIELLKDDLGIWGIMGEKPDLGIENVPEHIGERIDQIKYTLKERSLFKAVFQLD